LLAKDAPDEPEKVQVVARLARSGAAVGAGAGAGTAKALATAERPRRGREKATIVMTVEGSTRLV